MHEATLNENDEKLSDKERRINNLKQENEALKEEIKHNESKEAKRFNEKETELNVVIKDLKSELKLLSDDEMERNEESIDCSKCETENESEEDD